MNWDSYFMSLVYLVAMKSKDESTKLGAVIVGPDKEIRSTGYNSFPRRIKDNKPERQERPEKYYWFAHAERNAIDNAARMGLSLKNCRMYTQGIPCMDCARSIVQVGINLVIIDKKWGGDWNDKWSENSKRTKELFDEAGVELEFFDGNVIKELYGFRNGEKINL